MSFQSYAKIPQALLAKLAKGGAITVNAEHQSGDHPIVQLHFRAKKKMNRLHSQLSKGKSMRISRDDLDDVRDTQGGSLFGSLAKAVVAPVAGKAIGALVKKTTGSNMLGDVSDSVVKHSVSGLGFKKSKKGGNVFSTLENIGKKALPVLKTVSKVALGSGVGEPDSPVNQGTALGGVAPNSFNSIHERMAYVRSHRKVGGSMVALGGSMQPLGYK